MFIDVRHLETVSSREILIGIVRHLSFYLTSGNYVEISLTKQDARAHTHLLKLREIAVIKSLFLKDEN